MTNSIINLSPENILMLSQSSQRLNILLLLLLLLLPPHEVPAGIKIAIDIVVAVVELLLGLIYAGIVVVKVAWCLTVLLSNLVVVKHLRVCVHMVNTVQIQARHENMMLRLFLKNTSSERLVVAEAEVPVT